MKYLHPVAAVPNELINDPALHYTTKAVALALLFLAGRKNTSVRVTVADLARLSHCAPATVRQAVDELLRGGYLAKKRTYRYSEKLGREVYGANLYLWLRRHGGYTLVRREILQYALTPASLSVLLFLYRCAGCSGRAFPSLRHMAGLLRRAGKAGLDMSKSTVCRALRLLRSLQAVMRHCCRRSENRNWFSSNSYYLTDMVIPGQQKKTFSDGCSPKFDKLRTINQITGAFTSREAKYGVAEFGGLHNFAESYFQERLFYFDGIGVKVSPVGEHPDLVS